jgi:hypothetical protein
MFDPNEFLAANLQENADDDGSGSGTAGGSGASGFIEPVIDMALFGVALFAIREGEKQFGGVPDTKLETTKEAGTKLGKGLRSHPKLSQSAQFSGVAPKLNSNPQEYPDAEKNHQEMDQQHQLDMQPGMKLGKSNAPRLDRH